MRHDTDINDPAKQESSLPESLQKQLGDFQRYVGDRRCLNSSVFVWLLPVWGIGFLTVFIIDRWVNTSTWIRIGICPSGRCCLVHVTVDLSSMGLAVVSTF